MAAVPTTHTFADGVVTSSEDNAYIRDPIDFLMNKPAAELRQLVAQTLTTGTWTAVTFISEDLDDDPAGTGGHDNASATSRWAAVYAGWYLLDGGCAFAANATERRGVRWAVNGAAVNGSAVLVVNSGAGGQVVVPARGKRVFLNVGDYVELQALQLSGGNLDTFVGDTTFSASMSLGWDRLA